MYLVHQVIQVILRGLTNPAPQEILLLLLVLVHLSVLSHQLDQRDQLGPLVLALPRIQLDQVLLLILVHLSVLVVLQIPFDLQYQFHQECLAGLLNLVFLASQVNQPLQDALFHLVPQELHVHHLGQMVLADQVHLLTQLHQANLFLL